MIDRHSWAHASFLANLALATALGGCWTSHGTPACDSSSCPTECCAFEYLTGAPVEPYCLAERMTCREAPPAYDASFPWSSDALLVAPDAGPPSSPDAGPPEELDAGVDCSTAPAPDRACSLATDCTMVFHLADCCGTGAWVGLRTEAAEGYGAYVAACEADFPACGCAARPTLADDGSDETRAGAYLHVECVAGQCESTYISLR